MKLRGIGTGLVLIFSAILVVGIFLYFAREKEAITNDMKSKMTNESLTENRPNAAKKFKEILANNLQKQNDMIERTDFENGDALTKERFYTEQEISEMTLESFQALLKETDLKMPKISDIKELPPGALHRTPPSIIEAGKSLGLIKEILNVHKSYEKEAVKFYDTCAKSNERPTPVRALCLTNLIEIKKNNGESLNLSSYPKELIELSRMITDL